MLHRTATPRVRQHHFDGIGDLRGHGLLRLGACRKISTTRAILGDADDATLGSRRYELRPRWRHVRCAMALHANVARRDEVVVAAGFLNWRARSTAVSALAIAGKVFLVASTTRGRRCAQALGGIIARPRRSAARLPPPPVAGAELWAACFAANRPWRAICLGVLNSCGHRELVGPTLQQRPRWR